MEHVKGLEGEISHSDSSIDFLLVPNKSYRFHDKFMLECSKGHAVCNQCRERDENKCMVTCGEEVGLIRCLAIERVIESAKVQCAFGRYGCKTTIAYRRKKAHELFCSYAPCSCPVLYCSYKGSSNQLSTHFSLKHPTPAMATNFSYEKLFKVSLDKSEPFVILREEEEGLLFLLHNRELKEGNSVAVRYMAAYSQRSKTGFTYEVVHKTRRGGCLRFESRVERVKSREEAAHRYYSYADFLLIPSSPSYSAATPLQLEMCIKRN
ncbi:hypothetical protein Syun_022185 [Stephania yunnanensis]|uniref:SIAH-type domain-containing protein n=1 Tax=Stephania yunnanensis TaxID=152371 RepID=A0AAP0NQC3_9MAGN